jgi:NAD(P)H dehydrogenase (quinone)
MSRIGIVWHSSTGYTSLLAGSIAKGAASVGGANVDSLEVRGEHITEGRYANDELLSRLDDCDAIIFGTPTYMGAVSAQTKAFMDACLSRWYERAWSGKIAAAFTVSSTPSGDKLNALNDLFVFGMQMGMIWVGQDESPISGSGANRLGIYVGAAAQPDYEAKPPALMAGDAQGGELLGARVAALAGRLAS